MEKITLYGFPGLRYLEREAFRNGLVQSKGGLVIPIEEVIGRITNYFGLTKEEVVSEDRHKKLVEARHWVIFILRREYNMSYTALGKLLDKNHATCLYACNKLNGFLEVYPDEFNKIYKDLIQILSE